MRWVWWYHDQQRPNRDLFNGFAIALRTMISAEFFQRISDHSYMHDWEELTCRPWQHNAFSLSFPVCSRKKERKKKNSKKQNNRTDTMTFISMLLLSLSLFDSYYLHESLIFKWLHTSVQLWSTITNNLTHIYCRIHSPKKQRHKRNIHKIIVVAGLAKDIETTIKYRGKLKQMVNARHCW